MKSPSSDAELLCHEQAAPVRSTHRLFVATDVLSDLERGHEPIRQSVVRRDAVRRRLRRVRSMRRFRVRRLPHRSLRAIAAPNDSFDATN